MCGRPRHVGVPSGHFGFQCSLSRDEQRLAYPAQASPMDTLLFGNHLDAVFFNPCVEVAMFYIRADRCFFSYAVRQKHSLGPLYSDGPLSSRPQPRESDGDVTPREDTREDFGRSFFLKKKILSPSGVVGWLLTSCVDDAARHVPACVVATCATGLR